MNLKSNIRIVLLAALFLKSPSLSAQHIIKTDTTLYKTLRINPGNAIGGNVSDIFERVSYIPLETTPESTFGSINQLAVIDDYYIILDRNTNCILIFTKAGKFHAKIRAKTDNPDYIIWKFIVNKWTKQIIYFTQNFTQIIYCSFDGKVVKTGKLGDPRTSLNNIWRSLFISENNVLSYTEYRKIEPATTHYNSNMHSLLKYINGNGNIYAAGMLYTEKESKIDVLNGGIGPLTNFGNDTTFFFSKPYANSIYTVTPNSIKLSYRFVFPLSYSLPVDFASNSIYDGKRISFIQKNTGLIFNLANCYQVGDNLLFKAGSYVPFKEDNLIFNLRSSSLIAYKHILPDEKCYFLPIFDNVSSTFDNLGIGACDGRYLYTSLSSLCMFQAKEDIDDKHVKYSQVLTDYFKNNTRRSNPVILQLQLKTF